MEVVMQALTGLFAEVPRNGSGIGLKDWDRDSTEKRGICNATRPMQYRQ